MIFKLVKDKFYFATLHVSWIPKHVIQQYNLLHWYATRYLWDVVVSALTFLLLQFDGDTSHWPSLDTLHQVSDEPVINKHYNYYLPIHCRLLLFIDVVKAMVVWGVMCLREEKACTLQMQHIYRWQIIHCTVMCQY